VVLLVAIAVVVVAAILAVVLLFGVYMLLSRTLQVRSSSEWTNALHAVLSCLHARGSNELHRGSNLLDTGNASHTNLDYTREREQLQQHD
jgi:archaellin